MLSSKEEKLHNNLVDKIELISLPNEVSALKLCLVPLFDSNKNPGKSSLRIVLCICPSVFTMDNSPAFLIDIRI